MNYIQQINETLVPTIDKSLDKTVLDLFAGCGGLSLGFEAVGFQTIGYEKDKDAAATYNQNLTGTCHVVELNPQMEYPEADIIIGGPPCQPFSVGGKQKGLKDARDGFPTFLAAVEQVRPAIFLFENVRGLLYKNRWYLDEIIEQFQRMGYQVNFQLLNAKHYGVPQNRERVIVIGAKHRIPFLPKTVKQVTAGDALGKLAEEIPPNAKFLTPSMDRYIAKYEKASKCVNPRDLYLNRPARTLTCRNLAGATGDMHRVKLPDGRRRRLTIREAARLQSFPDWFEFKGKETSVYNQIGNAVAPYFSWMLANMIRNYLEQGENSLYMTSRGGNQLSLFKS